MNMTELLARLANTPDSVTFDEVIAVIDDNYHYTPAGFDNGDLHNQAGENAGSCKIFAFAALQGLSQQQTLHCFGDYYRQDVLLHPDSDNHQNIRHFIDTGWDGIHFHSDALSLIRG